MLDERTKEIILMVFDSLDKIHGRTYLQKIFFLIENELLKNIDLNYIKYHYGPFSKDLQLCVNDMIKQGLIKENKYFSGSHETHSFTLTTKGKNIAKKIELKSSDFKKISKFCDRFRNHSPSELLRYVYAKYPEWTKNSVLV